MVVYREEPVACCCEGATMPVELIQPIMGFLFLALWAMIGQVALKQ